MPTTFGELTALAQDHLRYAVKHDLATASTAELVAVTCAMAAATTRVADLIAEPPHRPRNTDPDPAWRLAGATVTEQVARARELLTLTTAGLVPERTAFRHRTAAHLLAGRTALGASRDLLATHTDLSSGGPVDRTPEAALLRSTEARHQLIATAAGYADHLAALADLLAARTADSEPKRAARLCTVAGHLATAAAATRFLHRATTRGHLVSDVEVVPPRDRQPVRSEGTAVQLLDQALACARRIRLAAFQDLGAPVPLRHDVGTLSFVASAMLAGHVAQQQLLDSTRGTPVCAAGTGLLDDVDAAELRNQAGLLAWTTVRQYWAELRGLPSADRDKGIRLDAADLVRCLRAATTTVDPTPLDSVRTASATARSPSLDVRRLLERVSYLQETERQIAVDHAQIATTLAAASRLFVPTRSLEDSAEIPRAWSPAPELRIAELGHAYVGSRIVKRAGQQDKAMPRTAVGQHSVWRPELGGGLAWERA